VRRVANLGVDAITTDDPAHVFSHAKDDEFCLGRTRKLVDTQS
jgi:hypothetical protein